MKVIVLKVRHQENLQELEEVIQRGHTYEDNERERLGGAGGWQMPKNAQPGDLAIWYAGAPDQEYCAYGWIIGDPHRWEARKYYGRVAGVRRLTPVGRRYVAEKSGFNEDTVNQFAETVYDRVDDFLRAVGFSRAFVAARELISEEISSIASSAL
jgi:hypothetical protein